MQCSAVAIFKLSTIFEQEDLYFHFSLGPTNCIIHPESIRLFLPTIILVSSLSCSKILNITLILFRKSKAMYTLGFNTTLATFTSLSLQLPNWLLGASKQASCFPMYCFYLYYYLSALLFTPFLLSKSVKYTPKWYLLHFFLPESFLEEQSPSSQFANIVST